MTRTVTIAGYAVIAAALVLLQVAAVRARNEHRARRPLTFGEFVTALVAQTYLRWLVLAGWLWLGWHLFARVEWR